MKRIFNHNRTLWKDTNIRENKNIQITYYKKKHEEGRSKRINRIWQEIGEHIENGGKIWEFKRKLEKKIQIPYFITNAEGIKLENRSDIQKEYSKYCKILLKIREPDNKCKKTIEVEVNKKF